jgi:hypothetical protein
MKKVQPLLVAPWSPVHPHEAWHVHATQDVEPTDVRNGVLKGCGREFYGISRMFLWDSYGILMGFLWDLISSETFGMNKNETTINSY